jgi:hypothetical protein
MPSLATMPMPVFAAGLRQPVRPEAPERKEPQERQAKLQWTEQWRLLRQKAELLVRGALPKAAPSEKELFEVVQPFLEATAALERARSTEASNAWTDLQRVKQATARFRELVLHVGAGPEFVAELQEVMEGAEERLRVLREQHERRSLELHQQELALTQELEAMGCGFDGPVPEEPPAAPGTREKSRHRSRRPAANEAEGVGGAEAAGGAEGGEGAASEHTPADARARLAEIEIEIAQLGGASCGWAEEEHAAFMKLRTRLLGPATELAAATAIAVAQGEASLKMVRRTLTTLTLASTRTGPTPTPDPNLNPNANPNSDPHSNPNANPNANPEQRALRSRGREAAAAMAGLLEGFGHDDAAVATHEEHAQRHG